MIEAEYERPRDDTEPPMTGRIVVENPDFSGLVNPSIALLCELVDDETGEPVTPAVKAAISVTFLDDAVGTYTVDTSTPTGTPTLDVGLYRTKLEIVADGDYRRTFPADDTYRLYRVLDDIGNQETLL